MVARRVTDVMQNGVKKVFALSTALGKQVVATGNHPFLTRSGWKWLEELAVGDEIATPRTLPLARGATLAPPPIGGVGGALHRRDQQGAPCGDDQASDRQRSPPISPRWCGNSR